MSGKEESVISSSRAMYDIMNLVDRLSMIDSTVLLTGESGVGKGVIARMLHDSGARRRGPFVKVNCGAIPGNLIESELFGYESGAFTGSKAEGKKGLFETADGGTIFLDEIAELPLNLQVTLLQVIQDKEIKRVGGVKSIPVDVRVISASNKDLAHLVKLGDFREDLYYRLNVVPINVPPLRERHEDIVPLIRRSFTKFNRLLGENKTITPDALAILVRYDWPGNVRELENIVERLIITTRSNVITPNNIPAFIIKSASAYAAAPQKGQTLREQLEIAEKQILQTAFHEYPTTRAMAKALDVSQATVVRKLQKYGICKADTKLNR